MRAIFYAGLLAAAALVTMSCKQSTDDQRKPDEEIEPTKANIFTVEAKPDIETSPEDAAWQMCHWTNKTPSQNFITRYIYKYGDFITKLELKYKFSDGKTHLNRPIGGPSLMPDHQWLEQSFDIDTFHIHLFSDVKQEVLIANKDIHGEPCLEFVEIAKQNKDTSYNGRCWNNYMKFSYIPTEYLNIECFQDYDVAHPSGTLLNDIAVIDYFSAETMIRSGYKNIRAQDPCPFARTAGGLPEPLNQFNTKQVNMVEGLAFMVSLTQAPDVEGVYTFKLTYKDISGEVRTATTIPIRLAAK